MTETTKQPYAVIGFGRAYTDLIAAVPSSFPAQFGIPLDGIKFVSGPEIASIAQRLPATAERHAGGAVANTLAGIAALGGKVGFMGKLAPDEFGQFFLNDMKARHIPFCCKTYATNASFSAACLLLTTPDNKRSMASHVGCADAFAPSDLPTDALKNAKNLMIEANMLTSETSRAFTEELIAAAKKRYCNVVISLSTIQSWYNHKAQARLIAQKADIVIGNQEEVSALERSVKTKWKTAQTVLTTCGESGVFANGIGHSFKLPALRPATFVNSIGAGDQFAAGFLMGESNGLSLRNSVKLGATCAAMIIGEKSGRPATPAAWQVALYRFLGLSR